MGYGMLGHAGIGFQDSFGAANVDSMHWIPIINESLSEAIPSLVSEGMRGRFEEGEDYEGPHEITGDIVFPPDVNFLGALFKGWCGQECSVLVVSCWQHLFVPRNDDWDDYAALPPMTCEIYRDAGSAHQYYDCLIDALSIEIAGGELVKITASMIGGKFSKIEKSTPSYNPSSDYTWDQVSLALASAAIDEVLNLTVNVSNNLEGKRTLDGTKTFNRIKRGGYRTTEVAGTILFVDDNEFDNYRNQVKQDLMVNIEGPLVSSGYTGDFAIHVPSLKYNEFPVNIGGPGTIEVSFAGSGRYNSTYGYMVFFGLQDNLGGY